MAGHCQQLLSSLNYQRFYGYHCDVTLQCGDDKYNAHICVLSAYSPKLQQMINTMAKDTDLLSIESVPSNGLKLILDYIYTGVLKLDALNVLQLFDVAQCLEMKEAEKLCSDYYKNGGVVNQTSNNTTFNDVSGNVANAMVTVNNTTSNEDPNYIDDYLKLLDTPQTDQHTNVMVNGENKSFDSKEPLSSGEVEMSEVSTQTEPSAIHISDESDDSEDYLELGSPVTKRRKLQAIVKFVTKVKSGDDTINEEGKVNGNDQHTSDLENIVDEDLVGEISGELDATNEGVRQIIKSEKQDDYTFNIGNSLGRAEHKMNKNSDLIEDTSNNLTLTLRMAKGEMSKDLFENFAHRKASVPMKLSLEDEHTSLDETSVEVMNAEVMVPIIVPVNVSEVTPRQLLIKPLKKRMYTSKHSSGSFKKKKGRIDKKRYKLRCIKCQRLFKNQKSLTKHDNKMHQREGSFPCEICSINFGRKMELTRHMHTHSRDPYICPYCEYESDNPWQFKHHMADAHDDHKPFRCKVEGCVFRANKPCNLVVHSAIHNPEKKFKCTKCLKSFAQNSGLRSHLRSCYQERTFSCHLCGCRFNHAQSLSSHMRKHTGEKPFHCEVCNKDFTDHRNYKRHRLIHENIYPYACTHCDKRYRHSNSLKSHLKTHGEDVAGPLMANNTSPHKLATKAGRPRCNQPDMPPTMVPFQSHIPHMNAHSLAESICSQIHQQQTLTQNQLPNAVDMKLGNYNQVSVNNPSDALAPQQPPSQQAMSINTLQPIHHPQQNVTPTPADHIHHALQQTSHDGLVPSQITQQLQQQANNLANSMSQIGTMPLSYNTNTHALTSQNMSNEGIHSALQPPPAHETGVRKPTGLQHPTDLSRFCSIVAPPLFSIPTHDMLQHMSQHPLLPPSATGMSQPHYSAQQMGRH